MHFSFELYISHIKVKSKSAILWKCYAKKATAAIEDKCVRIRMIRDDNIGDILNGYLIPFDSDNLDVLLFDPFDFQSDSRSEGEGGGITEDKIILSQR